MHFVSINTFLWAALRKRIACRREEIVVRAVFLPRGWSLAGALLPACFISKRCGVVGAVEEGGERGEGGGSFWSRLLPADLSGEVEKRHSLSKLHFRQHLATSHFYRGPRGLRRKKSDHINVQGAVELTGQAGKEEGVQSISA